MLVYGSFETTYNLLYDQLHVAHLVYLRSDSVDMRITNMDVMLAASHLQKVSCILILRMFWHDPSKTHYRHTST